MEWQCAADAPRACNDSLAYGLEELAIIADRDVEIEDIQTILHLSNSDRIAAPEGWRGRFECRPV
jgi:hypothetical protein